MTKGTDYFESTVGTGGPIVLVPCGLVRRLSLEEAALAPQSDDSSEVEEAYEKICEGNEWLRQAPFEGGQLLRMGEGDGPFFWIPRPDGALAVQWLGADSEEQLLAFALENADSQTWEERVTFEAVEDRFYLADSTVIEWDIPGHSELCTVHLPRGTYQVVARFVTGEDVACIIFRFVRQS